MHEYHDQVINRALITAAHVPTLGIVGTADPDMSDFLELKRLMLETMLVAIAGASHANALRRPQFLQALEYFSRHTRLCLTRKRSASSPTAIGDEPLRTLSSRTAAAAFNEAEEECSAEPPHTVE